MKGNIVVGLIIGLVVGVLIGWNLVLPNSMRKEMGKASAEITLRQNMNHLWEDHVWWTREYLKGAINNAPDTSKVANRLLKNQEDIGNAIRSYYGDSAGAKLTALLKAHITGAVDLVNAAKSGNKASLDKANTSWFANADEIANFLAQANPYWSKADLTQMMHDHLDLTKQEAVDILSKNYDASIADFEKVNHEILMMADALSSGIIKQFPEKF